MSHQKEYELPSLRPPEHQSNSCSSQNSLTKRWSESPSGARSHFKMIETVSVKTTLARGGSRSTCARWVKAKKTTMKTTTSRHFWLKGSIGCTLALLALGTGRAIAADASVTAIDILLKPDAIMVQHATATNDRLRKVFPKGFALDAEHHPHITLVQ